MENKYVLKMEGITKEYFGNKVLKGVELKVRPGEIHALMGENGAGKSTLMSVLFGLYQPEAGEIRKNGEVVKINNPNEVLKPGDEVEEEYLNNVQSQCQNPDLVREKGKDMKFVYTPFHGTGNKPVRKILERIGFENVIVVYFLISI